MLVPPGQITRLLADLRNGKAEAEADLAPLVYDELRRIAARHIRKERPGHTLQPTALVHEAYLKLLAQDKDWHNRSHFFAVASSMMRRILVDYARQRGAHKRGAGVVELNLADYDVAANSVDTGTILALDQALSRLSELDERQCRIVEMRFFGGMTEEEIGEALGLSARTVKREWAMARAWLHCELSQ